MSTDRLIYRRVRKLQQHRKIKRTPSQKQKNRRKSFIKCCIFWNTLDDNERDSWNHFAVGAEHNFNAYLRLNLYRFYNNLEPFATPPPGY